MLYSALFILDALFNLHSLSPELIPLALEGPIDSHPGFALLKDSGNGSSSPSHVGGIPPFSEDCSPSEVSGTLYAELLDYLDKLTPSYNEKIEIFTAPSKPSFNPHPSIFDFKPLTTMDIPKIPSQVERGSTPVLRVPGATSGPSSHGPFSSPNISIVSFDLFYPHVPSRSPFNSPFSSYLAPSYFYSIGFINSLLYLPAVPTALYVLYFGRVSARMLPFPGPLYRPSRSSVIVFSPMLRYHVSIYIDLILSPILLTVPPFPAGYPVNFIPLCIYNGPTLYPHIFEEFSYVVSGMTLPSRPLYTLAIWYDHNYFIVNFRPVIPYTAGTIGPFLSTTGRISIGLPLNPPVAAHYDGFALRIDTEFVHSYAY